MANRRVAPPKCLLRVANQIEKDRYTLIEQSAHLILLKLAFNNTTQLCNQLIISLAIYVAITVHDVHIYAVIKYIMCMMSL